MIASHTKRRLALLSLLALTPLALPSTAFAAAEGAPTSLLPGPGTGTGQYAPVTPPAASPVSPSAAAPAGVAPSGHDAFPEYTNPRAEKVQVQDLSAPDPAATGVLDQAHGGLGTDLWAGTSLAALRKLMPALPALPTSRVARSLQRRLLLSAAAAPDIKSDSGKPDTEESLIKLRADKLWAMGEVEGLTALLKAVPSSAMTADMRRVEADSALLAGDATTACNDIPVLRQQFPTDPFSAKLGVFCQYAAGKGAEAQLGVDVLREQKLADPAFFAAADALAGIPPGKLDGFAQASPLALAMARTAKLPLPEVVAATPQPAVLRTVALMPDASVEARLAAVERAEALGLVETETLRQLYDSLTFKPEEIDAPLAQAGTQKGARSRALLYRAAAQQLLPNAKAEIIGRAFSLAGDGTPAYFTAARLYAPLLIALKPDPSLAGFGPVAARALFAAGYFDIARNWVAFARGQGTQSPELANAAAGLWPLARLTEPDDDKRSSTAPLAAWRKARGDQPADAASHRAAIGYGLLSALGVKVSDEEWLSLPDAPPVTGPRQRPAIWQVLRLSTEDLRLGETVLAALATLGDTPLSQADPGDLYRVVSALRLLGLDAEARSLAVEAAIANGV